MDGGNNFPNLFAGLIFFDFQESINFSKSDSELLLLLFPIVRNEWYLMINMMQ